MESLPDELLLGHVLPHFNVSELVLRLARVDKRFQRLAPLSIRSLSLSPSLPGYHRIKDLSELLIHPILRFIVPSQITELDFPSSNYIPGPDRDQFLSRFNSLRRLNFQQSSIQAFSAKGNVGSKARKRPDYAALTHISTHIHHDKIWSEEGFDPASPRIQSLKAPRLGNFASWTFPNPQSLTALRTLHVVYYLEAIALLPSLTNLQFTCYEKLNEAAEHFFRHCRAPLRKLDVTFAQPENAAPPLSQPLNFNVFANTLTSLSITIFPAPTFEVFNPNLFNELVLTDLSTFRFPFLISSASSAPSSLPLPSFLPKSRTTLRSLSFAVDSSQSNSKRELIDQHYDLALLFP